MIPIKKTALLPLAALVMTTTLFCGSAHAQQGDAALNRADVETIVREYLLENPEILIEMSRALSEKQQAQAQDKLFENANDGFLGNPDGQTVVVEFFDYNCPYCRDAFEVTQEAIAANPDLKVILKEYPILGPDSEAAHHVAVAVRRIAPDQYAAFHSAMFSTDGRATEQKAVDIASELGISEDSLKAAMAEDETEQQLQDTQQLGMSLQVNGTPTYFDKEGPFGFDQLATRAGGKATDG